MGYRGQYYSRGDREYDEKIDRLVLRYVKKGKSGTKYGMSKNSGDIILNKTGKETKEVPSSILGFDLRSITNICTPLLDAVLNRFGIISWTA